jgi:tRNA modification GTPase
MANLSANNDTIFARASGAGKAGIALYRLSGPAARAMAGRLAGKDIEERKAVLVALADPQDGAVIDRGLAILFNQPKSYTGEDVAEFHLHGGRAVETALYEALAGLGARPAEPGEFTLRALKNGKLDLAQAEALADLIDSETSLQRKQALGQLDGRLSGLAEGWRRRILGILAPLEADIDFPDEGGVPAAVAARAGPAIAALMAELKSYRAGSEAARRIREGVAIAVIGPPNAGKSSLVNALAGSEVAIVSETPGTTRDIVEARLDLGGVAASVADTAGLRIRTDDVIEAEGVRRARARAEAADFRIAVLNPQADYVSRETLALLKPGDFLVWSKADLAPEIPDMAPPAGVAVFVLSARTGAGLDRLLAALGEAVAGGAQAGTMLLTRARHVRAVDEALAALARAQAKIEAAPELAAEDARLAARALGTITGAVGVEDVLGEIFSSFCIGK